MVLPDSDGIPRVPPYSGATREAHAFRLQGYHLLWPAFPCGSTTPVLDDSLECCRSSCVVLQPRTCNASRLAHARFGLFRVRSPLLAESLLISLPEGTEMFHFPSFAARNLSVFSSGLYRLPR